VEKGYSASLAWHQGEAGLLYCDELGEFEWYYDRVKSREIKLFPGYYIRKSHVGRYLTKEEDLRMTERVIQFLQETYTEGFFGSRKPVTVNVDLQKIGPDVPFWDESTMPPGEMDRLGRKWKWRS